MIGFWATLSLNIPDFSRYAVSQRDQVLGQALGLPLTMALYSFIGVAVTSATIIIYGETHLGSGRRPDAFQKSRRAGHRHARALHRHARHQHRRQRRQPGQRFRPHLAPRQISFRTGGLITGVIGILMMPWKLRGRPGGYIFTWLVGYSALLGPIGGILIADYFVWRRRQLNLAALYQTEGEYRLHGGFSLVAHYRTDCRRVAEPPGFLVHR